MFGSTPIARARASGLEWPMLVRSGTEPRRAAPAACEQALEQGGLAALERADDRYQSRPGYALFGCGARCGHRSLPWLCRFVAPVRRRRAAARRRRICDMLTSLEPTRKADEAGAWAGEGNSGRRTPNAVPGRSVSSLEARRE